MASGARGTQATRPACDAAPAARRGLQVARRRMRVTDRRFPRTGAEQRGRNLSPEAGAAREPRGCQAGRSGAALRLAHVPAVVHSLRSWRPGQPDCGGGDWVWSCWGSCSDWVARAVLRLPGVPGPLL